MTEKLNSVESAGEEEFSCGIHKDKGDERSENEALKMDFEVSFTLCHTVTMKFIN